MNEAARSPVRRHWPSIAAVLVFAIALWALSRLTREIHVDEVIGAMRNLSPTAVGVGLLFTLGSYLVLTLYDVLALRQVGRRLSYGRTAIIAFIAYAVGYNVGLVAVSAGAVRYRLYALAGLGAVEIGQMVAFSAVTFGLGVAALLGVSLIVEAGQAPSLLHASPAIARICGASMLLVLGSYCAVVAGYHRPVTIRGRRFLLPTPSLTVAQLAVAVIEMLLASAALYVLLPVAPAISFTAFCGLYTLAMVAGIVSAVPGGLGVFESVLLLLLPGTAPQALLGGLLAYRVIYYVLPFAIAMTLLTGYEIWRRRERLQLIIRWTRRSLDIIVPHVMSVVAFVAGSVLLLSGATPAIAGRVATLSRILPLPVLEISHLAGSAVGVALLVLARGLYCRLDAAWHVMVWLLAAGIAVSMLKGLDYEEAILLGLVLVPLVATRQQFYRRASLLAEPLAPRWLVTVAIAIAASIWIGLIAHREVPYQHELWWQFAFDANAPRMMRASLVAVVALGTAAVFRLLQPRRPWAPSPTPADVDRAAGIVRTAETAAANLALLGDKSLLFSSSGRSFVMYGVWGRSWIALGDPVGPRSERGEMVWLFRDMCDREGGACVFYEVTAGNLPLYVDAGLSLSKLGEEARVRLDDFSLDGAARAPLRHSHRKAEREGATFRVADAAEMPALAAELRAVSDAWLVNKGAAEKGFSLGFFDPVYLARFPCALVERGGRIVAFANMWDCSTGSELSIDLMRFSPDAPKGVMDYLFAEVMLWGKANGRAWFNLGVAPLAGLEQHRLAPAWHKLGGLVYRYGENFYNFEGLRQYKEKFHPQWTPRYLACPGGMALPRVLLDVTSLIARGPRRVGKDARSASGAAA